MHRDSSHQARWRLGRQWNRPPQSKLGDRVYLWESGPRGGIIGLAEVSEPPRIQPEPKEQLLFIRNGEKFQGDRLRVKIRLLKLIEPAIQRTYLSSRAEFATLSILRRPRATNFRVTRRSKSPGRHCGRHGCGS